MSGLRHNLASSTSSFPVYKPVNPSFAASKAKSMSNNIATGAQSGRKPGPKSSGHGKGQEPSKGSVAESPEAIEKRKEKEKDKDRMARLKREYKAELSRAKRAKYSSASVSAHQVLKDLKNSASRQLSSVKSSFDNLLSQKLRLTSPKEGYKKSVYDSGCIYYNELENEPRTPVHLYSPFGIESPSPAKSEITKAFRRQRKVKPAKSLNSRLEAFSSPTGKIRDDVRSITNSMNELSLITHDIQYKFSISTSPSNFSITTQ
jgi:hypothetical protein